MASERNMSTYTEAIKGVVDVTPISARSARAMNKNKGCGPLFFHEIMVLICLRSQVVKLYLAKDRLNPELNLVWFKEG